MNYDGKRFLEKIGYSEGIVYDDKIYSPKEINEVVADYGLHDSYTNAYLSIADIVGYEYEWMNVTPNVFKSLDSFFDSNGNGYHSRSVGLLDYSTDELLAKLQDSYIDEPIKVSEIDKGKYIITSNGLHRYTVLRCHYLQECASAKDEFELKSLRDKYTIPVQLQALNYEKTYCNFLNSFFNFNVSIRSQISDRYETTGNTILTTNTGNSLVFNDDQLIAYVNLSIIDDDVDLRLDELRELCTSYTSLSDFLVKRVPAIGDKISNKSVGDK